MLLSGIITGIVVFLSTGTDDLLVMTALLNGKNSKNSFSILVGTLLGTLIMFAIVMTVGSLILKTSSQAHDYLRFAGIIPLSIGLMYSRKSFSSSQDELQEISYKGGIITAAMMYLSNSTDDFIVNSSTILTYDTTIQIVALGVGNLIGVCIYYQIAKHITKISQHPQFLRTVWRVAGAALVIIGIRIIVT